MKLSISILSALLSLSSLAGAVASVNLGSAGNFTILAKTGISNTGTSSIIGDMGLSPAAASFITGFGLIMDPSVQFSTSSLVAGKIYASDYTPPTPAKMTTAISDMETAYTDAAGRTLPDTTDLGAGNLGGLTLAPGLHKWGTAVTIPTDLTLSGSSTGIWVFQVAGTLDISSATKIVLSGGAKASNIFWQVAGQVTLGTTSVFNGNILGQTAIVLNTGATLNGRALAQSAVTLDGNSVVSVQYSGPNPPVMGQAFAYPSPAKGSEVHIVYNMAEAGKADVRVWNDGGDLVARVEEEVPSGPQKTKVSISSFAPGIYLYKVIMTYSGDKVEKLETRKFAVSK